MRTVERRHSPVYRQLEAYEESWKREHDQAMACRDWEDAFAVGLAIYRMLWSRQDAWREQVFRGAIAFSEEDNLDHQARVAQWLTITKEGLNVLPVLEKRFGKVEGEAELRKCAEAVEAVLSAWVPPHLSMAVGLREQALSPEAAAEFDRILREARTNPPTKPGAPMPREISAEDFFALVKPSR